MEPRAVGDALRSGVLALCGDGDLATRLAAAWRGHLSHIDAACVPGSLRARFEELRADLCYGGDTIEEALARMNRNDRWWLAERIVAFHGEFYRHLPPEE